MKGYLSQRRKVLLGLSGQDISSDDPVAVSATGQAEEHSGHCSLRENEFMSVKLTATYILTTDHAKSRSGQSVLLDQATGQAFLPSDTLVAYESWPKMPAAQVVSKMASWRDFSDEERRLIEQFSGVQRQTEVPERRRRDLSRGQRPLTSNGQSK